ncbi:MAG: hypothetical protein CMK78_11405 [Pseudomonadales bacterium]|nr:hypothetical protein [Pseudomonadales bacterium]|tara:strand:+ start:266 stop:685 length:420 start_codon:yes stop_codon:yes gene_type:complete
MLQQTIPSARAAEAARISASVEEFLASGGRIQRLPIYRRDASAGKTWTRTAKNPEAVEANTLKHIADKHCKKHPGGDTKKAVKMFSDQRRAERDALAPQVKEMSAKGVFVPDIAKALGISPGTVVRIRREHKCGRQRRE